MTVKYGSSLHHHMYITTTQFSQKPTTASPIQRTHNLYTQSQLLPHRHPPSPHQHTPPSSNPPSLHTTPPPHPTMSRGWICKKCATHNRWVKTERSQQRCKTCTSQVRKEQLPRLYDAETENPDLAVRAAKKKKEGKGYIVM